MWGRFVVVALSILLTVATELWFPIDKNDPIAVKQKHFWAAIFLIFSLVLGLPIQSALEAQAKLEEVKKMLAEHQHESVAQGKFKEFYTLYQDNFSHGQPVLQGWADELLDYLRDSWRVGLMPLPRERAAAQIGTVYSHAHRSIVATNVGSTKFYFTVQTYAQANREARDRGIPVIRFYLYGRDYKSKIELRDGRHPTEISDFLREVKDLHNHLGSLYSAVIDVDNVKLDAYRDLLIMDNGFVAETQLTPAWEPIRAVATENPDRLKEARQYLHVIQGAIDPNYVVEMKPTDVKAYFKNVTIPQNGNPAEALFKQIMEEVAGQ